MVLGSMKSDQYWRFAAYGKHTAARDFFRVGQDFPLMKSLSDWVEKGYGMLVSKRGKGSAPHSWRFWAKGYRRDIVVCGLIRDSSDSLGRSYPFLIVGAGPLKDWEGRWDLLPFACEETWSQMEYVAAHRFADVRSLENEVQNIRQPSPEWSALSARKEAVIGIDAPAGQKASFLDFRDLEDRALLLSRKTESVISLDQQPTRDQFALIIAWHYLLKNRGKVVPHVTFLGGAFEKSFLVFYNRPLVSADFLQLWSLSSAEVKSNGSPTVG